MSTGTSKWSHSGVVTAQDIAIKSELLNLSSQNEFLVSYSKLLGEAQLAKSDLEQTTAAVTVSGLDRSLDCKFGAIVSSFTPVLDDTSNFAANLVQSKKPALFTIRRTPFNAAVTAALSGSTPRVNLLLMPYFFQDFFGIEEKQLDTELF